MSTRDPARPPYDAESDIAAVTVGGGILLTQGFALFPGLLPCLLLLLPVVLPLVALGLAGAILVGLPLGAWRLVARLARAGHRGDVWRADGTQSSAVPGSL